MKENYDGQINLENFRLLQDIDPTSKYKFDYKIINDDLETAYIDLKEKLDLLYKKEMI